MNILRHFYHVGVATLKKINCKHKDQRTASCPYTGLTYTSCKRCWKRLKVEATQNG